MSEHIPPVPVEEPVKNAERAEFREEEVVSGLLQGDQSAWTALYDAYSVRVWGYVAKLVGSDVSAVADIVQETMLAAAQSARNFDPDKGSLWQWLLGIAHNRISLHWRSVQRLTRLRELLSVFEGESNGQATTAHRPEARLERQELAEIVRGTLARMPCEYVELLNAKYIENLSIAEIQQQTGATSDAVRSKLSRARKAFRDAFQRLVNNQDHPSL